MLKTATHKTPSDEFKHYCDAEFEHRRNSGTNFDEALYTEAMNLVPTSSYTLSGVALRPKR